MTTLIFAVLIVICVILPILTYQYGLEEGAVRELEWITEYLESEEE